MSEELWKKVRIDMGMKTPESSRALESGVAMIEAKTDNSSNESLFLDDKPKANNSNNPAVDRKEDDTNQSHADS